MEVAGHGIEYRAHLRYPIGASRLPPEGHSERSTWYVLN